MRLPSVAVVVPPATLLHVASAGPSVRLYHHCVERPAMFSVAPVPLMPVTVSSTPVVNADAVASRLALAHPEAL